MLAVLGALFANGLITVLKFIAAVITDSSGMMAEAPHSLADTTNQLFLLLGLRFYKRPASEKQRHRAYHQRNRAGDQASGTESAYDLFRDGA
jgi:divalent metal cation (Fe/Co/Zn/Cd) transporter